MIKARATVAEIRDQANSLTRRELGLLIRSLSKRHFRLVRRDAKRVQQGSVVNLC